LNPRFNRIQNGVNALAALNSRGARKEILAIGELQRGTTRELAALGLVGAIASVLIGIWASRLVARREEETLRYQAALETRNRDLDAFAARVAHDLRGPLGTVSLVATELAEENLATNRAQVLTRAVTHMDQLIADLLALSRVEAATVGASCDIAEAAAHLR